MLTSKAKRFIGLFTGFTALGAASAYVINSNQWFDKQQQKLEEHNKVHNPEDAKLIYQQGNNPAQDVQQNNQQAEQSHQQQDSQSQKDQQEPVVKQQEAPKQQPSYSLDRRVKFDTFSQIPHCNFEQFSPEKKVLIVADIGYTPQFEEKILAAVNKIKASPGGQQIEVLKVDTQKIENAARMRKTYSAPVRDETIFFVKNSLEKNFLNIEFDMFMQYPSVIGKYMTDVKPLDLSNEQQYLEKIRKMPSSESCLMYVYDETESAEKMKERLLAAKYIELELTLHSMESMKVLPVEANLLKKLQIVPESKIKPNSIHIIRKHNEFTHADPTVRLEFPGNKVQPYIVIPDIGFHNKKGEVAVQHYLSKVETFNSLSSTSTPYMLSVVIDRNRISTESYWKIMETFKHLKRTNKYPGVGMALRFSEVNYMGADYAENKEFNIKMANLTELDKQSYLHEVEKLEDIDKIGISEADWNTESYEYQYPHQAISVDLLSDFIEKVIQGQQPQIYRSDKSEVLRDVHKVVANTFETDVLQNENDHLVFEYSDNCPSCKMISPLIAYMNEVLNPVPIEKRFDFHRMNCHANRVKGQIYSPYTPNMNYFKNKWKHTGPVRIPLQTLNQSGLNGLYEFCLITKHVKTIDYNKFCQGIDSAKKWKKQDFLA